MALRIPSPKALTKPEAYLAYKAGIMSRDELKQSVYNPLNNYEGWLAKWCELLETYPTNKDGTPQCLTDEEGLLAYLCGVTDRYPATNSRPDDARVSAYIRYLVSARYERPDHPLNREEFYLSLIKTQFIPSGNPSSDIVIDGTTKAPFLDVKVYGGTLQYSYSGKNLWNGEFGQGQTYNPTTTNRITTTQSPALLSGQTYTVSAFNLPSGFRYAVALFASPAYPGSNPGTAVFDSGWKTSESFTFTPSSDCYFAVIMSKTDNTSLTPSDVSSASYQLELGSTATSYEPFVGGTPAPNPSYPQPISVVTGENVVKVVGKNLFHFTETRTVTASGVTFETTEGTSVLKINGTSTLSSNFSVPLIRDTSPLTLEAGTYTIKIDGLNRITGSTDYVYLGKVGIGAFAYMNPNNNWQTTFTLTEKTSLYMQGVFASSTAYDNKDVTIQLELGSQATSYQAYTAQDYTINLGELELAKIGTYQDRIYKDGEKWYVEKQVGKVVLDGTETNWASANNGFLIAYTQSSHFYGIALGDPSYQSLCDHFTVQPDGTTWTGRGKCGFNSGGAFWLMHTDTAITTVADFKTWLASNNTTVYYALATPTITEITNQPLIDQLNALKQGGAEEGTTYIKVSATDPNLPAKLYVEAPKYD